MAAGDYVVRRNASNTDEIPDAGSDYLTLWDTSVNSSGSGITYASGTFTLGETGHFLVLYSDQWGTTDTTTNERTNTKYTINLAGTELIAGYSTGYVRRSGGSQEFINFGAAVINVTTTTGNGDDLQVRAERIDNSATGTVNRIADRSGITIIKLDDDWNYGRYESTSAFTTSSTDNAVTNVANLTNLEEDSPFTRTGTEVDIASTNHILAVASYKSEDTTPTGRSEYQGSFQNVTAGIVNNGSICQTYGPRVTDNCDWGGMSSISLISSNTYSSGDNFASQITSRDSGGDTFEGSFTFVELPSGAEICRVIDSTSAGNINAAGVNYVWNALSFIDTDAFTHTAGQANIDVDNDGDYLVMGSNAQWTTPGAAATRAIPAMQFRVNTTDDNTTGNSAYNRNNGTSEMASLCAGTLLTGLSTNDSIYVRHNRIGTVSTTIAQDIGGFAVVRFSSLFAAGDTEVLANTDALTLAEQTATVNAETNVLASTDALTLATLQATVTLAINVNVLANTDALVLAEQQATVNAETNVQAATDALTLAEQQATVNAETNVLAATDALTLAEQAATVSLGIDIQATTDALTLAEQAATIVFDVNVQASTDALVLATFAATIGGGTVVSATTDALILAEQQATVSLDIDIQASTDALVLAEQAATVNAETSIAASTDALTLAEQAATVNAETNVNATTDALVLATHQAAVTIGGDTNVLAATDALVLTEHRATVLFEAEEEDTAGGVASPALMRRVERDAERQRQREFNAALLAARARTPKPRKQKSKRRLKKAAQRVEAPQETVQEAAPVAIEAPPVEFPPVETQDNALQRSLARQKERAAVLELARLQELENEAIALLLLAA